MHAMPKYILVQMRAVLIFFAEKITTGSSEHRILHLPHQSQPEDIRVLVHHLEIPK